MIAVYSTWPTFQIRVVGCESAWDASFVRFPIAHDPYWLNDTGSDLKTLNADRFHDEVS